jgi:hypothetical protein
VFPCSIRRSMNWRTSIRVKVRLWSSAISGACRSRRPRRCSRCRVRRSRANGRRRGRGCFDV